MGSRAWCPGTEVQDVAFLRFDVAKTPRGGLPGLLSRLLEKGLFWNASVLSMGFMVLVASSLKPNHSLGQLVAGAILGLSLLVEPSQADPPNCNLPPDPAAAQTMLDLERSKRSVPRIVRIEISTRFEREGSALAELNSELSSKTIWALVDGNENETRMLFVFTGPGRLAGTTLLVRDELASFEKDDTWFYLRAFDHFERLTGGVERTVVPGTSFSYEDARGYIASAKYRFRLP